MSRLPRLMPRRALILQEELQRLWMQTLKTVVFVTHSVDEAIYLSDRVTVMTARPGVVKAIVPDRPAAAARFDLGRV